MSRDNAFILHRYDVNDAYRLDRLHDHCILVLLRIVLSTPTSRKRDVGLEATQKARKSHHEDKYSNP